MEEELIYNLINTLEALDVIKYADEDWGQLDYYGAEIPVQYPCALVNIDNVTWTNQGNAQQQGTGYITVDVAMVKLTNSSGRAPKFQRAIAGSVHTVKKAVHQALQNKIHVEGASKMYRKSTVRIRRQDGVQHYRLTYALNITETVTTGVSTYQNAIIGIGVTPVSYAL